jgi:hypothetical protein
MNVDGLTPEHVKSHLQKYRNSLKLEKSSSTGTKSAVGKKKGRMERSASFTSLSTYSEADESIHSMEHSNLVATQFSMHNSPPPMYYGKDSGQSQTQIITAPSSVCPAPGQPQDIPRIATSHTSSPTVNGTHVAQNRISMSQATPLSSPSLHHSSSPHVSDNGDAFASPSSHNKGSPSNSSASVPSPTTTNATSEIATVHKSKNKPVGIDEVIGATQVLVSHAAEFQKCLVNFSTVMGMFCERMKQPDGSDDNKRPNSS